MENMGLYLNDLIMHDQSREMIMTGWQHASRLECSIEQVRMAEYIPKRRKLSWSPESDCVDCWRCLKYPVISIRCFEAHDFNMYVCNFPYQYRILHYSSPSLYFPPLFLLFFLLNLQLFLICSSSPPHATRFSPITHNFIIIPSYKMFSYSCPSWDFVQLFHVV